MSAGYAQPTAAGIFGSDYQVAAYGIAIPSGAPVPAGASVVSPAAVDPQGGGYSVAIPRSFFHSSGFGLILLVALVIYFDVRVLNR